MTAFPGDTFVSQKSKTTAQIRELQKAIQDNTHKLEEIRQQRLCAEEEIIQCTRESERRLDLIMEKGEVVDLLQQLGHLLQEEGHLSEQLNGQASTNSNHRSDLQKRTDCITSKAGSLTEEILEVKRCLAEAKARYIAAQDLTQAPTSKSKRNQGKPK